MRLNRWLGVMCGAATIAATSVGAFAQGPGRGRGFQLSAARVPVATLASALKLTDDQKTKIGATQTKLQADTNALMPTDGSRPDPSVFQKLGDLNQTADKDIQAVLTDDQKAMLPGLLKDWQALQFTGVPLEALEEVKLTDDQRKQLVKIGTDARASLQEKMAAAQQSGDFSQMRQVMTDTRQGAQDKANAILTADQKKVIAKYPQQGFGFGRPRPAAQ